MIDGPLSGREGGGLVWDRKLETSHPESLIKIHISYVLYNTMDQHFLHEFLIFDVQGVEMLDRQI